MRPGTGVFDEVGIALAAQAFLLHDLNVNRSVFQ
jgi:hypothetical protein